MGSISDNTYIEKVPDGVDKTQEQWEELSYHTQYYYAEGRKEEHRKGQNRRRKEKKNWLREIKSERGCTECSESDPRCLDFHHIRNKTDSLSSMAANGASKEKMREEIEKCVVICANCHRKKHRNL